MENYRRRFLKNSLKYSMGLSLAATLPSPFIFSSCKEKLNNRNLKISLQAYSFAPLLMTGKFNIMDFPEIVKNTYGLNGAEYWSIAFMNKEKDKNFLDELNKKSKDLGISNTIILVDDINIQTMEQGPSLASLNKNERNKAIEYHKRWIEVASKINCHSIRVNLKSDVGSEEDILETSGESISKLAEYGSSYGVSTIVENHGGLTGNAKWLVKLIKEINSDFVGTLPDFGNHGFCMKRERLDLGNLTKPCDQQYDKYEGVEELLPFAKGISAKSHEFDDKGNDINTDFEKMINIIKESSYEGYIAIEYEGGMLNLFGGKGNYLTPHEGVIATKTLLEKLI
mgnify:CR=1 FL=1